MQKIVKNFSPQQGFKTQGEQVEALPPCFSTKGMCSDGNVLRVEFLIPLMGFCFVLIDLIYFFETVHLCSSYYAQTT